MELKIIVVTHCGLMTSDALVIIDYVNGMSHFRHKTITWTKAN